VRLQNFNNHEGVISVKLLTNLLILAVFSNGLIQIVKVSDASLIVETTLSGSPQKVTTAQISFNSSLATIGQDGLTLDKKISIGITFDTDSMNGTTSQV
jgi:hypothetical protein